MIEMEVVGVQIEPSARVPVLVLRETAGEGRILPVFIGQPEASSIHAALNGDEPPRPLTHDLLVNLLAELGARLERVTVTELRSGTFFAELSIASDAGQAQISSRTSDAIALAVRTGAPVFAAEAVLDEAGQTSEASEEPADEIIDEFRRFIEDVSPEDFES